MGSAENLLRRVIDEIIGSKGARGISDFSHSRKVLRRYTEDGLKASIHAKIECAGGCENPNLIYCGCCLLVGRLA